MQNSSEEERQRVQNIGCVSWWEREWWDVEIEHGRERRAHCRHFCGRDGFIGGEG